MLTINRSGVSVATRWRDEVLAQREPQRVNLRRGFAAVSFIDQSNSSSAFVDTRRLLAVVLYEDERSITTGGRLRMPLRLAGYRIRKVPHGMQWGGAENCCFFKDMTLAPRLGARGQRIDRRKSELLNLAFRMNRRLSRAGRYPAAPRPVLRLPRLWAGFHARYRAAYAVRVRNSKQHVATNPPPAPMCSTVAADRWAI